MQVEQHMYTSCPPGKGIDGSAGFQTKARSPGLTKEMNRIICRYCEHYRSPRSAQDIEYKARREGRNFSPQELAHFPIALIYYPVEQTGNTFALTRICYIGQDYSGRFGNFFAHTLVFPVETLQPLDYNPFALTQINLFQSNDTSDQITLPALNHFQKLPVKSDQKWMQLVTTAPYAGQLAPLLSVVSGVQKPERSVIFCLPKWEHAAILVEALLMLLPPEMRCRTPFTTYEHDPYRLLRSGPVDNQAAQIPLRIIVTPGRDEGGAFQFTPDEYQHRFRIFNFVEHRFSPQPSSSAYAQYVADLCIRGHYDEVISIHNLITEMGVGQDPSKWDVLLPAIILKGPFDAQRAPKELPQAISALKAVAVHPSQVVTAMNLLWPSVQALSNKGQEALFKQAIGAYWQLREQLPANDPHRDQTQQEVLTMVHQLLKEGHLHRTQVVLTAVTPPARTMLLATALRRLVEGGWPGKIAATSFALPEQDKTIMPELLAEGLQAMQSQAVKPQVLANVVLAVYEATGNVGGLMQLWRRTGPTIVKPLLNNLDQMAALNLATRLLSILTKDSCPDGLLDLRLWRWGVQQPQSMEEWLREAAELAQVALQCSDVRNATNELVNQTHQRCGANSYPVVLAAMWQEVGEEVPVKQLFCEAYVQALEAIPEEERRWKVRQDLAKYQLDFMLAYNFFGSLQPWPADGPERVRRWMQKVFRQYPHQLFPIARGLVQRLRDDQHYPEAMPLAAEFLHAISSWGNGVDPDIHNAILQVAVSRLPLRPLAESWHKLLRDVDVTDWHIHSADRLLVLRLMTTIETQSKVADTSPALFLEKFPAWTAYVDKLSVEDQRRARSWLLGRFKAVGVSTLPDARKDVAGVLQLVFHPDHADCYDELVDFMRRQLAECCLVSQVLQLGAFVLVGVEETDRERRQALAVLCNRFLAAVGQTAQEALWEYLAEYPRRNVSSWQQQFQDFRVLMEERTAPGCAEPLNLGEKASRWVRGLLGRQK